MLFFSLIRFDDADYVPFFMMTPSLMPVATIAPITPIRMPPAIIFRRSAPKDTPSAQRSFDDTRAPCLLPAFAAVP